MFLFGSYSWLDAEHYTSQITQDLRAIRRDRRAFSATDETEIFVARQQPECRRQT
jgi:hypothetical protein